MAARAGDGASIEELEEERARGRSMTKRLVVLLSVLCLCIMLVFGTFWPKRGRWHRMPVERSWSGMFTKKEIDEFMNEPQTYVWIRVEDRAVVREDESFAEKLKRWFRW